MQPLPSGPISHNGSFGESSQKTAEALWVSYFAHACAAWPQTHWSKASLPRRSIPVRSDLRPTIQLSNRQSSDASIFARSDRRQGCWFVRLGSQLNRPSTARWCGLTVSHPMDPRLWPFAWVGPDVCQGRVGPDGLPRRNHRREILRSVQCSVRRLAVAVNRHFPAPGRSTVMMPTTLA